MELRYIGRVLNGDTEAFKYFVHTYKDYAFKLSYTILKDQFLAEESIQEAFIQAFEKLDTFKQDAKFKTWFSRIVINLSLQKGRAIKHENHRISESLENELKDFDDGLQRISKQERKKYITETFKLLSSKESLALELFYLNEYTILEITEITGWSASKTKMLLLRGRKTFYSKLKLLLKTEVKEIL